MKVAGRCWAVDPDGYFFLHNAPNDVEPGGSERIQKVVKVKHRDRTG